MVVASSSPHDNPVGGTMRPHHPTQPNDKLIPATVELDENGNPMFLYQEPTPKKLSPKIVASRSIMSRLHNRRRSSSSAANAKLHTSYDEGRYIDVSMMDLQHHLPRGQVQDENRGVASIHHSLLDYDEYEVEDDDASVTSSSSVISNISGSLKSRVKMRLRRHRKKQLERQAEFALSPLKERNGVQNAGNKDDEDDQSKSQKKLKNPFKLRGNRRSSNASASVTSRSSSFLHDDVENDPLTIMSVPRNGTAVVEPRELDTELRECAPVTEDELHDDARNRTPPPVATLKAAMESASKERRLSEPVVKPTSLVLTPPSRRSSAPVLQKQPLKSNDHQDPVVKLSVPVMDVPKCVGSSSEKTENRRPLSTAIVASPSDASVVPKTNSNFKIYLLLLHPASKIFELIQLYFEPSTTTVQDVLLMIPANATEPVLGEQAYTGLCRPNAEDVDEQEISDLNLLIQNHDNMKFSAQVFCGEVLAAIPVDYSSKKVVSLSKQIMGNPRICRLLKSTRNDKHARKSKKRHSRRHHRRHHRSARKTVEVLEKHDEEKPSAVEERDDLNAMSVTRAMENARSAAAAANAAVAELQGQSLYSPREYTGSYGFLSPDISGTEGSVSAGSIGTTDSNSFSHTDTSETSFGSHSTYSLDRSYSSWSKSFDTSMSFRVDGSFCLPTPQNTSSHFSTPSTRRRNKRMRRLVGVVMMGLYAVYLRDPNGFAMRHARIESFGQPLAMAGLIQVAVAFFVLVKLQFLCSMPPIESSSCRNKKSKCPFVIARSSIQAGMNSPSKSRFASKSFST